MLKNRLKSLNIEKDSGKQIEIINTNDLSQLKGGKGECCPKLKECDNNCAECPVLECCGVNGKC